MFRVVGDGEGIDCGRGRRRRAAVLITLVAILGTPRRPGRAQSRRDDPRAQPPKAERQASSPERDGRAPEGVPAQALPKHPPDSLDGPPWVTAKAWAIADGRTGEVLWGHD